MPLRGIPVVDDDISSFFPADLRRLNSLISADFFCVDLHVFDPRKSAPVCR
jgi:hypothetical protein